MFRIVGKPVLKIDAETKLTGSSLYAGDMQFPDMLHLAVFRSPVARARIVSIDEKDVLAMPGVRGVFTAKDIPGEHHIGPRVKDESVLCEQEVNFVGDPIVLVASETEEISAEAINKVKVHFEELPAAFSIEDAIRPDAPLIHPGGNIQRVRIVKRGDAEKAIASADVVVSNSYRTPMVEHAYLEPEAAISCYQGDKLTVWLPCKHLHADHAELASVLNLDPGKLRLIMTTVGGYFGGKAGLGPAYYCALVTLLTGKPAKMVYTRKESFISTTKRHAMIIEHTLAARNDGTLLGTKVKILADTGAYASYGPSVLTRAAVHASGPYCIPNALVEAYCVFTNNPIGGAMRGFGVPQMAFAYEAQMDLLAEALKMDPLELRERNFLVQGSMTITGQKLNHSVGLGKTCEEVRQYIATHGQGWQYQDDQYFYGWGVASMYYGNGGTGIPNPADVRMACSRDGYIDLYAGVTEGGQGPATILGQIAAEVIGVKRDRIRIAPADTDVTPDSGTSSASRITFVVGRAMLECANGLKKNLINSASHLLGCEEDNIRFEDEQFRAMGTERIIGLDELINIAMKEGIALESTFHHDPKVTSLDMETGEGIPYAAYSYATQGALVRVNKETFEVETLKIIAAHDVGCAVNPDTTIAQIHGGVITGVGYGTMEELVVAEGKIQNPGFEEYLIPTAMDIPEIIAILIEEPEPLGPYGAKAVGEPALVPTAAAIRNAVARATGCNHIFQLPLSGENVWSAIRNQAQCL
ncbi:MAG: xanthine dehydrogenase family protein molybdopterin-binding subunit [Thermodesulfobacteriota bacterium]